jgi:hypothetical protein
MEYPKRVRVVYSDGAEEVGTAIDPSHVDVGPMGLQVKLRDVVEIDGVPQLVVGFGQKFARDRAGQWDSDERVVRLRLKSIPDWWTSEERKNHPSPRSR